jgi:hypothetical protein
MIDISMMKDDEYKLYKTAEIQVSDEHPYKYVCGRLCTGLHERNCLKFKKSVERRYTMLLRKNQGKKNK